MIADITGDGARAETMGQLNATSVRGGMVGAVYGFTLLGMMPIQQAWSWAFGGYALLALAGLIVAAIRSPETRTATPPSQQMPVQISVPLRRLLMIVLLSNFASALVEPIYLIYLQDKFSLGIRELAFAFFPAGIVYATLPRYAGRLTDRVGRTPMIALGVSCAALVSLLLPWLSGIVWVAACYTLFAAGWALAGPAEDALVGDLSSDLDRGRVFGFKEAAASAGAALGPLVGGAIYDHWRPELAFVTNGLLLLVTAALVTGWLQRALTRHDNRADA
jgi:MFS family permease